MSSSSRVRLFYNLSLCEIAAHAIALLGKQRKLSASHPTLFASSRSSALSPTHEAFFFFAHAREKNLFFKLPSLIQDCLGQNVQRICSAKFRACTIHYAGWKNLRDSQSVKIQSLNEPLYELKNSTQISGVWNSTCIWALAQDWKFWANLRAYRVAQESGSFGSESWDWHWLYLLRWMPAFKCSFLLSWNKRNGTKEKFKKIYHVHPQGQRRPRPYFHPTRLTDHRTRLFEWVLFNIM